MYKIWANQQFIYQEDFVSKVAVKLLLGVKLFRNQSYTQIFSYAGVGTPTFHADQVCVCVRFELDHDPIPQFFIGKLESSSVDNKARLCKTMIDI